jgi:hypothetical protein
MTSRFGKLDVACHIYERRGVEKKLNGEEYAYLRDEFQAELCVGAL